MNTKELECFLAVCEEKSIHKAADRMFISVQGMSRIIKKLESEVGAEIMVRTPQGIQLTAEGVILEKHACNIIDHISHMNREIMKSANGLNGKLSVALSYGVLTYYHPSLIVDFKKEYPDIDLTFKEYTDKGVSDNVWFGACDVGLTYTPVDDEHFEEAGLCESELFVLVHKDNPLSKKSLVTIEDLEGHDIVLQNEEFNINKLVLRECEKKGFHANVVFESTGICMCNKLCKANRGVSVVMEETVKDIKSDDVVLIPFKNRPYFMGISAIYRKGSVVTPEMKTFLEYMERVSEERQRPVLKAVSQ